MNFLTLKPRPHKNIDPYLVKFLPDQNTDLNRMLASSSVASLGFCIWLGTMTALIAPEMIKKVNKPDMQGSVNFTQKITLKDLAKKKTPPKSMKAIGRSVAQNLKKPSGGRSGKGNPNVPPSVSKLGVLGKLSQNSMASAYDLKQFKSIKDIDKTLDNINALSTHGSASIGTRRGITQGGFGPGIGDGIGPGDGKGIGTTLNKLLADVGGPIGARDFVSKIKAPKASEIEMGDDFGTRSKESILKVVRSKMGGLRAAYNKMLRSEMHTQGSLVFRLTITPSGDVVQVLLLKSTIPNAEFENTILEKIKTWNFEVIRGGDVTVTLPISFAE